MKDLLVSTVLVRGRRRPHHVSGGGLADALGHKFREDCGVQDVAGVDEGARGRCGKLRKAGDGLLCGDKGTVDVDDVVACLLGNGDGERVVGEREVRDAGCDTLVRLQ